MGAAAVMRSLRIRGRGVGLDCPHGSASTDRELRARPSSDSPIVVFPMSGCAQNEQIDISVLSRVRLGQ